MTRATAKHLDGAEPHLALPMALVKKSRLTWWLWAIPAGAAALCFWFVYRDFIAAGPLITIYFQTGEGLEDQGIDVRYRGVAVGEVKTVVLDDDAKRVKVQARLVSSAADLARQGSVFWIVRPEVRLGAISGLRTIISGDYIDVQPGTGERTNVFVGSEKSPTAKEPKSLQITLLTPDLGSLQEQSPIIYRGVQVGEVLSYQLATNARDVLVQARIEPEYVPLVRLDSQFWNSGGIDFHLGLFKGVQISAESPRTLISGGIEFATPTEPQGPATNGTVFILNAKPEEKWKSWSPNIPLQLSAEASAETNRPPEPFLKTR
ncbi:MAG TPA: MlaD family protein [Alphaproteobacteria bacterium]|nr:MlaD family protein [Alphaproteobacteria bacterium]